MHTGHLHPLESSPTAPNQCLDPIRLYKFWYFPFKGTTDLSWTVQTEVRTRLF